MTRERNLARLSKALPIFVKRLSKLSNDAEDGGNALTVFLAASWLPDRIPDDAVEFFADFIEEARKMPTGLLNQTLPGFQRLWHTPLVKRLVESADEPQP